METDMSEAYNTNVKHDQQFDKMNKLIAELDTDNHRLRKEFELYKEVCFF